MKNVFIKVDKEIGLEAATI